MIIILIIIIIIGLYITITYNSIIATRNNVLEAKSAIDTVFQNRYNLIPNLIKIVKKYMVYEKDVLTEVTKIRTLAMSNKDINEDKILQENMLSGTLKSIFALSENYPKLKANHQFINLQNQWQEIEDKLQAARRNYNATVKILKNKKEQFPSNIIAKNMELQDFFMFIADEESKKDINVDNIFYNK